VSWCKELQQKGLKNVLVTLGARGAIFVDEHGTVKKEGAFSSSQGQIVDTTGAGDCYRAAFVSRMCRGEAAEGAMEFASVAAWLCCLQKGAMNSMPSLKDVQHEIQTKSSL